MFFANFVVGQQPASSRLSSSSYSQQQSSHAVDESNATAIRNLMTAFIALTICVAVIFSLLFAVSLYFWRQLRRLTQTDVDVDVVDRVSRRRFASISDSAKNGQCCDWENS